MNRRNALSLAKFLKEIANQLELGTVTPDEARAHLAELFYPDEEEPKTLNAAV